MKAPTCARRGCTNAAAWVPFFWAYARLLDTREKAARSDLLTTLPHCSQHRKENRRLSDIFGPEFVLTIADMFEHAGKMRPVRVELDWEPLQ